MRGLAVNLTFTRHGGKWYAQTPRGEYAWSESQGLYEWRDGQRIHYSGADRQGSSDGQMWVSGPEAPGRDPRTFPHRLGAAAAVMNRTRLN